MTNSTAIFEVSSYPKATCLFSKQDESPLHLHRHLEFACILEGRVEFTINGEKYILTDGDSALIMPYVPHSYHPLDEECIRFVLVFEPEYIGSLGNILLENHPVDPIIRGSVMRKEFDPLIDTYKTILSNITKSDTNSLCYAQAFSHLVYFLGELLAITGLTHNSGIKSKLYLDCISLANEEFIDPSFDIDKLAERLHVSTSRIQQLFNKHLHISFKKYLTLLRISRAKSLLRETSMSMTEVATAAGFNSVRSFNRIFKLHKNLTPLAYKKLNKVNNPSK